MSKVSIIRRTVVIIFGHCASFWPLHLILATVPLFGRCNSFRHCTSCRPLYLFLATVPIFGHSLVGQLHLFQATVPLLATVPIFGQCISCWPLLHLFLTTTVSFWSVLYLFLATTVPFFGQSISDWRGSSTVAAEELPNMSHCMLWFDSLFRTFLGYVRTIRLYSSDCSFVFSQKCFFLGGVKYTELLTWPFSLPKKYSPHEIQAKFVPKKCGCSRSVGVEIDTSERTGCTHTISWHAF